MHPNRKIEGFTRQTGFTLMELMVGMTIGMIATIIIVQVMSVFEAQKRTTTGSADAQTNGGIALYSIGREMQMAGYPLFPGTDTALSCTTITYGSTGITGIAPVKITDGFGATTSLTDSITIRYGSTSTTGAAAGAAPGVQTQISALNGSAATVGSNLGCKVGDVTMINTGTTCAMSTVTAVSAAGASPITVTLANTNGAVNNANLSCLGSWNEVTYAVNDATGNLERTAVVNGVSSGAVPSVVGVVNIQAQYGVSASASSNQVTQWVEPNGVTWAVPTVADRNRIKAVRIAVIARNAKVEQSAVTNSCSSTTAASPTGLCAWEGSAASPAPAVILNLADTNWQKYRYRVFETTIPLRNVIWSKDTL